MMQQGAAATMLALLLRAVLIGGVLMCTAGAGAGAAPPSGLAPLALQPLPLGAIAPQVRVLFISTYMTLYITARRWTLASSHWPRERRLSEC